METLESRKLLSTTSGVVTTDLTAIADSSSGISGYTPAQIRQAYGFTSVTFSNGVVGNGAGQAIAIVDAYNDPHIASDLATFDKEFGIAAPPSLKVLNENGGTSLPSTNAGWDLEISLDVEWAHAIAPGADIVLVEASSDSYNDLLTSVNTARHTDEVSVISMSWGSSEFSGQTSYDSLFTTAVNHRGETFVAASGDEGGAYGAEWPATSDNVLAVGGTQLLLTSSGSYKSESGWTGSTGGISQVSPEPWYQTGAQNTGARTAPDVSYDASPNTGFAVYDSVAYDGQTGWYDVGGTSAGAPQWAALVAIADQGRFLSYSSSNPVSSLDGPSQLLPALYSMYQTSNYNSYFHDVSTGNNGYWLAGPGYDAVTGLGSPYANTIVHALVGLGTTYDNSAVIYIEHATPLSSFKTNFVSNAENLLAAATPAISSASAGTPGHSTNTFSKLSDTVSSSTPTTLTEPGVYFATPLGPSLIAAMHDASSMARSGLIIIPVGQDVISPGIEIVLGRQSLFSQQPLTTENPSSMSQIFTNVLHNLESGFSATASSLVTPRTGNWIAFLAAAVATAAYAEKANRDRQQSQAAKPGTSSLSHG